MELKPTPKKSMKTFFSVTTKIGVWTKKRGTMQLFFSYKSNKIKDIDLILWALVLYKYYNWCTSLIQKANLYNIL